MSCCGGSGNMRVKYVAQKAEPVKKRALVHHVKSSQTIQPQTANKLTVKRQKVLPATKCPKCGYPTMTVHIANRQRVQCSNANCRHIV